MFVRQHTEKWPLQVVCQVLKLSRSAYYNWLLDKSTRHNQLENPVYKAIKDTFHPPRRRYGVRRLVVELKAYQSRSVKEGLIIHSDRGGQYAGNAFRKLMADKKCLQSMSRADNPYDNAFMESCFSRFKAELMQDGAFENKADAQTEIFEYIEMYYNPIRRHSALN